MYRSLQSPTPSAPEPLLQITITPSKPFFFAGELFEATITLKNTRRSRSLPTPSLRNSIDHRERERRRDGAGAAGREEKEREKPLRRLGLLGIRDGSSDSVGALMSPERSTAELPAPSSPEGSGKVGGLAFKQPLNGHGIPGIPNAHPHARKPSMSSQPTSPSSTIFSDDPTSTSSNPGLPLVSGLESIDETNTVILGGGRKEGVQSARPGYHRNTSSSSSTTTSGLMSPLGPGPSRLSLDQPNPRGTPSGPPPSTSRNSFSRSRASTSLSRQTDTGSLTILWAHTRLSGHFTPSSTYIPPDPLLPLKSLMLHQPVGSGSLPAFTSPSSDQPNSPISPSIPKSSSRWNLSFGTGTMTGQGDPTLTGSLWGLAKGLVGSGAGGSLEDERRKVWNKRELPVFETASSLMGVEMEVGVGESRSFQYTLQIPSSLPPSFRGKAFRFSYNVSVSLNLSYSITGKQKLQDVTVPIKIVPSPSSFKQSIPYNILEPVIQRSDHGTVTEAGAQTSGKQRNHTRDAAKDLEALRSFAEQLESGVASPELKSFPTQVNGGSIPGELDAVTSDASISHMIRASKPAHFDITKHNEPIAGVDLPRSQYRAGETVVGVVNINDEGWRFQVMKLAAVMLSDEIIPESLLPPSPIGGEPEVPSIRRPIGQDGAGFTSDLKQLTFKLHIPNDVTPTSLLIGDNEEEAGGLRWLIQIHLLVRKKWSRGAVKATGGKAGKAAGENVIPITPPAYDDDTAGRKQQRIEVIHFELPITILPAERHRSGSPHVSDVLDG